MESILYFNIIIITIIIINYQLHFSYQLIANWLLSTCPATQHNELPDKFDG